MPPRRIFLAAVLISSVLATACIKDAAKTIGELQVLQAELTKKYGGEVFVNLNQTDKNVVITVSFINSALNEKPVEERYKRAEETAKVVNARYARIKDVGVIWVGFVRRQTRMLVFHYTETLNFYPFDRNGQPLRPPAETSTPGVALEAIANYSSNEDESNVFAYGIQLEGEPGGDGVTVLPNFKTKGDVNAEKGTPPPTVQFDFASYSSTPRFEQTTTISFIADGKEVLKTKGTFQGKDAQFCYLPVPYPAFRKIIDARSVTIKVGAKEYSLAPPQLRVVRKMGDYVTE